MQQTADWLEKLGLGYAQRFAENDINFAILFDSRSRPRRSALRRLIIGVAIAR
jgi:hypothetical protein